MKSGKIFYGWILVFASAFYLAILLPVAVSLANVFQVPVTTELGVSNSAFAVMNAIGAAMGIFLSPVFSKHLSTDKFKKVLIGCIIGSAAGFAIFGLAPNIFVFYIGAVVMGAAMIGCTVIPVAIMINNWFIKQRSLAMSIAMTGSGVGGFVLSPLITSWMNSFGWRNTYFIVAGLILILGLVFVLFIFKRTPQEVGMQPLGFEEAEKAKASQASGDAELVEKTRLVSMPLSEFIKKPFFIILLVGMLLNGIINNAALGQFPPSITVAHSAGVASVAIMIYSLVGVGGKILLGWITDKFGIMTHIIFAFSAMAITFFLMMIGANSVMLIYAAAVVFGLGIGVGTVSNPLMTSSIFSNESYGEAYGYVQSAFQVGMSLGSLVAASLADLTGSYTVSWIVMTAVSILTLVSWASAYKMSHKYAS